MALTGQHPQHSSPPSSPVSKDFEGFKTKPVVEEIVSLDMLCEADEGCSLSPARPSESPDLPEHSRGQHHEQTLGDMGTPSNGFLSKDIQEEEKKLEAANVEEENRIRSTLKKSLEEQDKKELQEQRYKRLMHLLTKSEFYGKFLLQQMESQSALKKPGSDSSCEVSESISGSQSSADTSNDSQTKTSQKRKGIHSSDASKRQKREHTHNYHIADVIDADVIKKQVGNSSCEADDTIQRRKQPRLFENGVLRPYQLDGFSWLLSLYENGISGILADEMGLGKTIQFISLLCHLVEEGVAGPFLVCGPLSTLPNWMSEFARFAPKVPTLLYHGPETERATKRRQINSPVHVEGCKTPMLPVVITSYEVAVRDTKFLQKYKWRYVCVDEGHRLKNHKCLLAKSLNTYPSVTRLLLTGTPLQNSLAELWSLLNYIMPEIFDSLDVFESWFDVTNMLEEGSDYWIIQQERENQIISTMMKILSPFFLRRMKKDVHLDLPPKKEVQVYTPMMPQQVKLYEATLTLNHELFASMKNQSHAEVTEYDEKGRPKRRSRRDIDFSVFLKDGKENETEESLNRFISASLTTKEKTTKKEMVRTSCVRVKLANKVMQLRRIVNHPYLVEYPLNPDGTFKVNNQLLKVCGKLQVLDQLLTELHRRGHRVLLFSQMTKMIDILQDYLSLRPQFKYKRLDGSNRLEDRQSDIREFNEEGSQDFLFLLSTRAGGLGVNLASADTVIIYDSDWNPQCDLQAQDRCHRIGQTSPVLVLRLIAAKTIDEHIVERAATKRKLEKLIIQSGKFKAANHGDRSFQKVMDEQELLNLLKERDHERAHQTSMGHVFSKEELDQILDRSDLMGVKGKGREGRGVGQGERQLEGVFKVISGNE